MKKLIVFLYVVAFALRCIVSYQSHYFLDRPELVTPLSNIKRVKEALFLQETGGSPYEGTAFHQPPIILSLYALPIFLNLMPALCIIQDLFVAYMLKQITILYNETPEAKEDRSKPPPSLMPDMVSLLYLFLPFSWTTVAAQSTAILDNIVLLLTLYYSLQGNVLASVLSLSVATYLSLYPVQFLIPLFMIFTSVNKGVISLLFCISLGTWFFISSNITGSVDWIYESYGFLLQVTDLTPNIGLFWYFFLEVFDHFRTFFCCVLQLNCFLYVIPLSICYKKRPVLLFWILFTFITTLKPYPSVADLALQFGLLPLFYPIVSEFLVRFIGIAQIYLYCFVLMPIAWYAWLYQGSGNANFFYGTTLAIGCAQVWLLVEMLHLALERQYKRKHHLYPFDNPKQ